MEIDGAQAPQIGACLAWRVGARRASLSSGGAYLQSMELRRAPRLAAGEGLVGEGEAAVTGS